MTRPQILLIYTGGTIGSMEDPETGALRPVDFAQLSAHIPDLQRLDVDLEVEPFPQPKDSSDIRPEDWIQLVKCIEQKFDAFDGFVILHGTDTLAYSASALSFMIQPLNKPIIFTGSQLPMGKIRTDGKENLLTAIEIAAAKHPDGAPVVPEVAVYFEYKLYRANRCFKFSAHHFNAFLSPNYPLLAEAGVSIHYNHASIRACQSHKAPRFFTQCDPRVFVLPIFPGISRQTLEFVAQRNDLHTLIIQTFGTGNGPLDPAFFQMLSSLDAQGTVVLNITQCRQGAVIPGYYETGREMSRLGVVNGKDLTLESALTKAMVYAPIFPNPEDLRKALAHASCGEMEEKLV